MDSERHNNYQPPPQLEEEYWNAILKEGEFSHSNAQYNQHTHFAPSLYPVPHYTTTPNYADPQQIEEDWQAVKDIAEADEILQLHVIGYNRGGLLVEWQSLRGFVPASQLINFPTQGHPAQRREALIEKVNTYVNLRIIEISQSQNRLVFSERAALVEPGKRAAILDNLEPDDIITGEATNITNFGVFIDLGGIEGLIHISELSWGRVSHPGDIIRRGETVTALVLQINKADERVALSLKRLHPDPWRTVDQRYHVGQLLEVRITHVVDFGAFACIETGLEGLIHISELAEGDFLHPRNIVHERQTLNARILNIDSANRRLGLSLRQVQQHHG